MHLEALAIAYPLAILMLVTLGFLQLAIDLSPEDWSYRHIWAFLPALYFLGLTIAWRNTMKNRLRVLRAERQSTQADLADRLEVSRQTVNAIETEKYEPSLTLAFKIAKLFSQRIGDLRSKRDQREEIALDATHSKIIAFRVHEFGA